MSKKNKSVTENSTLKRSFKQKVLISSLLGGILGSTLSIGIGYGISYAKAHPNSITNSTSTLTNYETEQAGNTNASNSINTNALADSSPLLFIKTGTTDESNGTYIPGQASSEVIDLLQSMDISSLAVNSDLSLKIQNYVLASDPTISSSQVSFSALYLSNPSTSDNITINFNGQSLTIDSNSTVWVYWNKDGKLSSGSSIPSSFEKNTTLLSLDGFKMLYTGDKTPSIPITSPYDNAVSYLQKNFESIVKTDLVNLFAYLNNAKSLDVTADGQNAVLTIKNLSVNWDKTTFDPSTETVTLADLTGTVNIVISALSLNKTFSIDNPTLTLSAEALVMWEDNNTIETAPQVTYSLDSLSVNDNLNNIPSSDLTFGYVLNSQQDLGLYSSNGEAFTLQPVSFGYLFYKFWMLSHSESANYNETIDGITTSYKTNKTFGSVYNDGNIQLVSDSSFIPSSWQNALSGSISNISNITLPFDNNLLVDFNSISTSKESSKTYTINSDNYPSIYNEIYSQVAWLKQLNKNITVLSFEITASKTDTGSIEITLDSINLTNDNTPSDNNELTYYLVVNAKTYVIYPTYPYAYTTTVDLNIPISLEASTSDKNMFNFSDISINFSKFTNYASSYYTAAMFQSYLSSSTENLDTFTTYLNQVLDLSKKGLSIGNLTYTFSDGNLIIKSFSLTNTTDNVVVIDINNTQTDVWANQTIYIKTTTITVNNFTNIYDVNSNLDISSFDNGEYPNLLTTNFVANSSEDGPTNNSTILNVLSNLLFNDNIKVIAYTSNASNTASKSLDITSLEISSSNACYVNLNNENILLSPNVSKTVTLSKPIEITGFNTSIGISVKSYLTEYLDEAQEWLDNLTLSQILQDFEAMGQLGTITTSMPSTTTLTYSDFKVSLGSYDASTNVLEIDSMYWNISGTAETGVSIKPSIGVSVTLDSTTPTKVKLIPVLYYTTASGSVASYPEIVATASNYVHIVVVTKAVSVNTELEYNLPSSLGDINDIRFGYYIQDLSGQSNSISGTGVNLDLTGADAQYKPYLNISNAFNQSVMINHYKDGSLVSGAYGSLSSKVDPITINNNFSVYGSSDFSVNPVIDMNNFAKWDLISFINGLYTNSSSFDDTLFSNLPYGVKITDLQVGTDNVIENLTFSNTSHMTYIIKEGSSVLYLLPETSGQIFTLSTDLSFNFNDLNNTGSVNLDQEYWAGNTYVEQLYEATRMLKDQFCMLYPLLWTAGNHNCLTPNWWHTSYDWNQGSKVFTINQKSWTADRLWSTNSTMYEYMVYDVLFDTNTFNNEVGSYSGYYDSSTNDIVITSLTINGSKLTTNLDLVLNGDRFRISGSIV